MKLTLRTPGFLKFIRFSGLALLMGLLIVFVILPLATVFEAAWDGMAHREPGLSRIEQQGGLAFQTVLLVLLTLLLALPVGILTGLALFRTDLPARTLFAFLILLLALLPVELHATAWLAALGPQGLARSMGIPIELRGLLGAAWIHAMMALPWVTGIVGASVWVVEPELEEDCLLLTGPVRTLWFVTLRRASGAVTAAALLVGVLTAGEMGVTDLFQVRTYAETVYTEFAVAGRVGAAAATAVPGIAVWLALVFVAGCLIVRGIPQDVQVLFAKRPVFRLGAWRLPATLLCAIVVVTSWGVPVGSLVWRTGLKFPRRPVSGQVAESVLKSGHTELSRPYWSARALTDNVVRSARSAAEQLSLSLKVAAATAVVTVPLAWLLASLARRHGAKRILVAGVACVLLALPAPVLGIALSLTLAHLSAAGDQAGGVFERGLAHLGSIRESPWVLVWLHCLRSLPYAIGVTWPVLRLVNRSLIETAILDGAGTWGRFWHVDLPAGRWGACAAALACFVLSLGELGGSVIVTPPGLQPLSVRIFSFAHYGLEGHLAGICLVLLATITILSVPLLLCLRWLPRGLRD